MMSYRVFSFMWCSILPLLLLTSSVSAAAIKRQSQDPPQKLLVYRLTLQDFNTTFDKYIPARTAVDEEALKPTLENATFENTIQVLADLLTEARLITTPLNVYPSMGETQELKQGALDVFRRIDEKFDNSSTDSDLFARVEKIYKQFEQNDKLDTTEGILTKTWLNNLQDSGGGLPKGPKRDRFLQLGREIQKNQDAFNQNINNINATVFFTREELDGVKNETLARLIKGTGENEGKLGVNFASGDDGEVQLYANR